jgi:hypothetical protein
MNRSQHNGRPERERLKTALRAVGFLPIHSSNEPTPAAATVGAGMEV